MYFKNKCMLEERIDRCTQRARSRDVAPWIEILYVEDVE